LVSKDENWSQDMVDPKLRQDKNEEEKQDFRKEYQKPAIIHEQNLEARAGSPIPGAVDILDLNSHE
jgi:hypothetical protein